MAIIAVYGDGTAAKNVIEQGIDDLFDAREDEEGFWFLLPYDGKPGAGMKRVMKWITDPKINKTEGAFYYELVVKTGQKFDDDLFVDGAGKIHKVKDPLGTVLEKLEEEQSEDNPGKVLILWDDDDTEQEGFIATALAAQFPTLDGTNGLRPIEFEPGDAPADEPEPEKPAPAGKKGGAPAKPTGKAPAREPEDDKPTREDLEGMPRRALATLAKASGVEVTSEMETEDIVNALLGETPAEPDPEPEAPAEAPAKKAPARGRGKKVEPVDETPVGTGLATMIGSVGVGIDPEKFANFLDGVAAAWREAML